MLVQISDPHVGATWGGADPLAGLAASVAAVLRLPARPDAVLVSGDLAEHGGGGEYETVRELLAPLGEAVHVLPGNHDDRARLRQHFGLPGAGAEPVQYAVDVGAGRLVALDTTRPGEDPGALGAERLAWLDAELAARPERPTVLAMHHPPIVTGVAGWDAYGLPEADRMALAAVVARHPQVRRLVAGHFHRSMVGELAGRPVVVAPSTYVQMRHDPVGSDDIALSHEPPALVAHVVAGGDVVTHLLAYPA